MADDVWAWCEKSGGRGRTITVKARYADFRQVTRRRTIGSVIDERETLHEIAISLVRSLFPLRAGIRLLGVTLSTFDREDGAAAQLDLLPGPARRASGS